MRHRGSAPVARPRNHVVSSTPLLRYIFRLYYMQNLASSPAFFRGGITMSQTTQRVVYWLLDVVCWLCVLVYSLLGVVYWMLYISCLQSLHRLLRRS